MEAVTSAWMGQRRRATIRSRDRDTKPRNHPRLMESHPVVWLRCAPLDAEVPPLSF